MFNVSKKMQHMCLIFPVVSDITKHIDAEFKSLCTLLKAVVEFLPLGIEWPLVVVCWIILEQFTNCRLGSLTFMATKEISPLDYKATKLWSSLSLISSATKLPAGIGYSGFYFTAYFTRVHLVPLLCVGVGVIETDQMLLWNPISGVYEWQ